MRGLLALGISIMFIFGSCVKGSIPFSDDSPADDPNISFYDNYPVEIATYKIDSFITSAHKVFTIGYHVDTTFGTITAGSYAEVNLPVDNPVKDKNVTYDSLVLVIKPNGNYYGDTLNPFKIIVNRLTEKMENEDDNDNSYYNPRQLQSDPIPLGQKIVTVRPKRGTKISIRLSDDLGRELLAKFKDNADEIRESKDFIDYFKGVYLNTDSTFSKSLYYFDPDSAAAFIRLHYRLNGAFSEEKHLDFPLDTVKQFNSIRYQHTNSNLAVFTPFKKQLKKSSLTGHQAYLHSNMASYIKISFPSILTIKELHPYVKVMKAELVIKPSPDNYRYPYFLPAALNLQVTDDNNGLKGILTDIKGENPLTGNLFIDDLYGEETQYTYDITSFITNLINEGRFSQSALMLVSGSGTSDKTLERLVINDQTVNKDIQLKLYVLGL